MVDHEERQVLQKLEDDALAEARQKAQEDARQAVVDTDDIGEEQAGTEADQEGVDTDDITG